MPTVSELIKSIKDAYAAQDARILGESLVSLVKHEPLRWRALLHMENIIPRPSSNKFRASIGILIEAFQSALQNDEFEARHFRDLFVPLLSIHIGLTSILERLDTLDVWEEIGARTICRASAFVEDQDKISQDEVEADVSKAGYFNSEYFLRDNLSTMTDDAKSNRLAGFEANCENLQLILAYAVQKYQKKFYGSVEGCRSVYEDGDFAKLIGLASLWRKYEDLWESVIFQGWHPLTLKKYDDANIYVPEDREEFVRSQIGFIRRQELLFEIVAGGHIESDEAIFQKIRLLAQDVILPFDNKPWACDLDIEILRECANMPWDIKYSEYEIHRYHYEVIAKEVRLGADASSVSWDLYQKAFLILRIIARSFLLAVEEQIEAVNSAREFFRIAVIKKSKLAEILKQVLELNDDETVAVVNALIFSPSFKNIEIWDTPLIQVDADEILFVPTLVISGNPARAMENIVAQWNPNLFTLRGKILEERLRQFLEEQGIKAQSPVTFLADDGSKIECDLVAYWEDYLILVEAKCTKEIFDPPDFFRAKKNIQDAINQLDYRKKQVLLNWENFRLAVPHLNLPERAVASENIKLIVATNVLQFTGWQSAEIVVTDEFCFRRFFGDAEIEAVKVSNDEQEVLGTVGRIRKHVRPTAAELFTYLRRPPQVEAIRQCISLDVLKFPLIKDDDPKIGMLYSIYNPEKHPARIASRKLFGRTPKKRKRPGKK